MHTLYRGRSHTKKQHNSCNQKITAAEREKRKKLKQLTAIFPRIKFYFCLPALIGEETKLAIHQSPFTIMKCSVAKFFLPLFGWVIYSIRTTKSGERKKVIQELFFIYKGKEIKNTSFETISERATNSSTIFRLFRKTRKQLKEKISPGGNTFYGIFCKIETVWIISYMDKQRAFADIFPRAFSVSCSTRIGDAIRRNQ
jgi:hypothetical protein